VCIYPHIFTCIHIIYIYTYITNYRIEELTETIDALDVEINELKAAGGSSSSDVIEDDVKESKEGVTTIGFGFSSSSSSFFTAPSTTAPASVAGKKLWL
jgi:hypothetical protein